ncbi:MAG: hypothetical protein LAN61_00840 [Acidobacteriia bacterium]|nr:hypothetical protein [Terriglobia bacterium]
MKLLEARSNWYLGILCFLLACIPAYSAVTKSVGAIAGARGASLNGLGVHPGTTLFSGDSVSTSSSGQAFIDAVGANFHLSENSSITLRQSDSSTLAVLNSGTLGFSSQKGDSINVQASDALIKSLSNASASGQITFLSPTVVLVGCRSGVLQASVYDETYEIPAGEAYRIEMEPQGPRGAGADQNKDMPKKGGRTRRKAIILFVGIGGTAAGLGIYAAVHQDFLSPVRP